MASSRVFLFVLATGLIACANQALAAVVFKFVGPAVYNDVGANTFTLEAESNSGPTDFTGIQLNILFDSFAGTLSGNSFTLNSFTPSGPFTVFSVPTYNDTLAKVITEGTTFKTNISAPAFTLDTPVTIATFSFTGHSGAFPEDDFFNAVILPNPNINVVTPTDQNATKVSTNLGFLVPFVGTSDQIGRAAAVPEPSTYAFCGLVVAGIAYRRRMKAKAA